MAIIDKPTYPSVPDVLGVPPVPRSPSAAPLAVLTVGSVASILLPLVFNPIKWGIYDQFNNPIVNSGIINQIVSNFANIPVLSTYAVEYSKESRISDFPIERGSFASFNKAEIPAMPVVTLTMGGSETDRATFLQAIDAASKSTALFSVVTPEQVYQDYSISRYTYQRRANQGANVLIVDLVLKEVRQVSAQYSITVNAKQPDAVPTKDVGKVQASPLSNETAKAVKNKLGL